MGGRRKFVDRKAGSTQTGKGEPAKILQFNNAHRGLRAPIVRAAKRPERVVPPPPMMRRFMRVITGLLQGISRLLRSQSRRAESSGKRRA